MHERTPVDEGIVTQALDPMWVPTLEEASSWHEGLYAMLRTASYYIVDQEQTYEAIESMPPALPSFPPLPFRRIWIETQHTYDDGSVQPGMYTSWLDENDDGSRDVIDVLGVAINEVVRGQEWQIFVPFQRTTEIVERRQKPVPISRSMITMAFHLTPNEIISPRKVSGDWHDGHLHALLQLAVNGAHLITARSVPKREITLPRHQRKRIERERWAPRMPKLYYVDLTYAGEQPQTGAGRTYHVRWLVSGHWRHIDGGESLCTCREHRHSPRPATYIEPYVKGPPGAPWIGRPVHRRKEN